MHSLKKTRVLELKFCKVLLECAGGQCCIWGIDGVFWHGTKHAHTCTHALTRRSTALQTGLIVDPGLKMKPSTLIQQSVVEPLPSRRLCFHMSEPPRAPAVIGRESELWVGGWELCAVLLEKIICCFHCEQEYSDVILVPFLNHFTPYGSFRGCNYHNNDATYT